jgi:hypothetical protein
MLELGVRLARRALQQMAVDWLEEFAKIHRTFARTDA